LFFGKSPVPKPIDTHRLSVPFDPAHPLPTAMSEHIPSATPAPLPDWTGASSAVSTVGSQIQWPNLRDSRLLPSAAPVKRIQPRVPLAQRQAEAAALSVTESVTAAASSTAGMIERPVSFTCPACMVVLMVRQPASYDGRPAPCPHCGVSILPPRIAAAASPFDLHPLPGLSPTQKQLMGPKTPRAIRRDSF
jgi:predicted RNA-binding Zn-ribbon protein involved in translation (DUF1610 family)